MADTAPVWLFTGPEIGERNTAIDDIRQKAVKVLGDLDYHSLYASDTRMGEVISLLQNGSLFSGGRFILLRNAEEIKKKEDVSMVVDWITSAASITDAYLVLVSEDIGIDRKIEAAIPQGHKRVFWEMFEDRKEQWIVNYFRTSGFAIDPDAVASILDLVENNTEALKSACSRFTLYYPAGHRITEKDTLDFLEHNREESPFTLFDSLVQGDLEQAIEIMNKLTLSRESSPVQTIAGLTWCFRRLADWHALSDSGMTDDFSLKKAGFSSKKAITQYRQAAKRWDSMDSQRLLALLADTDLEIRRTGTAVQDTLIQGALYSICCKRGVPLEGVEYR